MTNYSNYSHTESKDNMTQFRRLSALATQLSMPKVNAYKTSAQIRYGKLINSFLENI